MKLKKTILNILTAFVISSLLFTGCSKSDDNTPVIESVSLNNEVNDFIWRGLNDVYLWQSDVPNLGDTKFFSNNDYVTFYNSYDTTENLSQDIIADYFTFLNKYNNPTELFDALLYKKDDIDKFSYLVDDYVALENSFQGTSKSSGLDFGLVRLSGSNDILGYVRYIAKNSDAANKDIYRGDFFLEVDGQQLTINNYQELLFGSNDNFTLGMADITNNIVAINGKTVALTKTEFTEDPILINDIIEINGHTIAYLMYNQFIGDFDNALNDVFAEFKAQGATDLILDLRYNPGGRVSTAVALASMITGQFTEDIFASAQWNSKYQAYFSSNNPEFLNDRFTDKLADNSSINMLNLTKVYILTTTGTASASELIINGLDPYIDVIHIGTRTTGKYTASVTLYDANNFDKEKANPNHKYAMQPLVYKSANKNGVSDYYNGLVPDHIITYQTANGETQEGENLVNLGILGNINEPFLNKAVELITGTSTKNNMDRTGIKIKHVADTKDFAPLGKRMFDNLDFKMLER
ncbi:MAG: S41 family peptidase [Aestuariibaculum sp.]